MPNKHTTEMDAHLEAHPPTIEWAKAVKGVQHGTVIEEIPMPKKAPKPDLSPEPHYLAPNPACECFYGGETWHEGAMATEYHLEPNPDCRVHFPPERPWETTLGPDDMT